MTVLKFIASLVNSLAWPIALIVILLIFKKYIIKLIPLINSLKYKDLEIDFSKNVKELVENNKEEINKLSPKQENEITSTEDKLFSLVDVSPRSAIIESWLLIEDAASKALQEKDPEMSKKTRMIAPLRLGEYLNRYQIINGKQLAIFNKLRELRNNAVHISETKFDLNEVIEYIKLSLMLAEQIKNGSYK